MVTPDLAKYVRTQREKGLTDPQIRQVLVGNGWNDADLDSVLNATSSQLDVIMAGSANTEETVLIKKYQKALKWRITGTLVAVYLCVLIIYLAGNGNNFVNNFNSFLIWIVIGFPVALIASSIISVGAEPSNSRWKEILEFIVRLIGAVAITFIIALGLFFASCFLLLSSGGGNF